MTVDPADPSDPVDAFAQRYAMFRLELDEGEMAWFDWLLERARPYGRSIARRPQADFERPILLAMLLEARRYQHDARRELDALMRRLEEVVTFLVREDVIRERPVPPSAADLDRVGQARLPATGDGP